MKCIFCKTPSDNDISIEHIFPESIGNKELTLPKGVVCDKCNNYFSRKIEKPFLNSGLFRLIRNEKKLVSKRGKIPEFDNNDFPDLPNYRITGRFLGKIGLEVLAERTLKVENSNEEIVNQIELDELREFVRFNKGKEDWPFSYRTLYPVNSIFSENSTTFEILNEYDLLYTSTNELYIVVCLFGVELVMNLGGKLLDGYEKWLKENKWISPLYTTRNINSSNIKYL